MPEQTPKLPWEIAKQKRRSQRSEQQGAKLDGGRTVAMSGAGREKGDYRANGYRVEDKFTDAASFSITDAMLDKIIYEAMHTPPGLLPMLRVTTKKHKVRVLREEDYLYLEARAARGAED